MAQLMSQAVGCPRAFGITRAEVIKHPPRRTHSCYVGFATSDLNSGHFSQRPFKYIQVNMYLLHRQ